MIFRLRDLIPSRDTGQEHPPGSGRWVRAIHEPFWSGHLGRLRDAWAVLKGPEHAVAVSWPKPGEWEDATEPTGAEMAARVKAGADVMRQHLPQVIQNLSDERLFAVVARVYAVMR